MGGDDRAPEGARDSGLLRLRWGRGEEHPGDGPRPPREAERGEGAPAPRPEGDEQSGAERSEGARAKRGPCGGAGTLPPERSEDIIGDLTGGPPPPGVLANRRAKAASITRQRRRPLEARPQSRVRRRERPR